ncbi:MAG: aminotransferase class I/II-fold pyridoxal phosphate-dependent enzyme [Deltaproteobacteria bacterium]|nr:MAG: aminotransferase class I/II-fold pyridoxal phosphate-dependent enzyme [Deltaproteobacteria bacterium]
MSKRTIDTLAVHAPEVPIPRASPVVPPLYQTATFRADSVLEGADYDYTRSGNPTRDALQAQLAALEGGSHAFAVSSGMAAVGTLLRLVPAGGRVLAGLDLYGGSHRLLHRVLDRYGIEVAVVDTTDLAAVEQSLRTPTNWVIVESPTNPLAEITDLRGLCTLAHAAGAKVAVDNSLMSPVLQQPLDLGADVVLHSATKFLGGHCDVIGGALITRDEAVAEELAFLVNAEGSGLAPFDCWLVSRGLKTLALRVRAQQASARILAERVAAHPAVERVFYAGLADHAGRALHLSQARGPGAVFAFTTGDVARSARVVDGTALLHTAVSFGGVASGIGLPCRMSHASLPPAVREQRALPADLVRVSVGIEDTEELWSDLCRALDAVRLKRAV